MNDDEPSQVLAMLRTQHRQLDDDIAALRVGESADQMEIARLKKRKLRLRDEIEALSDRIVPDIIA